MYAVGRLFEHMHRRAHTWNYTYFALYAGIFEYYIYVHEPMFAHTCKCIYRNAHDNMILHVYAQFPCVETCSHGHCPKVGQHPNIHQNYPNIHQHHLLSPVSRPLHGSSRTPSGVAVAAMQTAWRLRGGWFGAAVCAGSLSLAARPSHLKSWSFLDRRELLMIWGYISTPICDYVWWI